MTELLLNPLYWLITLLFIMLIGSYAKSKQKQRDIQKGIEKALKKMNKKDNDEYWG